MFDLAEYVDKFTQELPVSKPVFVAKGEKDSIYFELENKVSIDIYSYEDPLDKLILQNILESFDISAGRFHNSCEANSLYRIIFKTVVTTYEGTCGLKNPRSSALYKWIHDLNRDDSNIKTGIIALYRYIGRHTDVTSRRYDGRSLDKKHANNFLAILGKMRDKYER